MREGLKFALPTTVVLVLLVVFFCACGTPKQQEQQQFPLRGESSSSSSSSNDNNQLETLSVDVSLPESSSSLSLHEQAKRRLWADVDAETLARYKADPTGFRRHPSYYSDKYVKRAARVDTSMGSWQLVDTKRATRPGDDFYNKYPSRDVPWADFPETAWQKDAEYLPKFLDEGIAMVERAFEAILTEYGLGSDRSDVPLDERIKTIVSPPQLANMQGNSYQGLVRRVLHAIVTEDTFVFAMSGHSAAAAHGNLFQQSYTHAYGAVVEPVFARLGVLSVSRNFGFGGLGTLQTGMATSDLMGPDIDILMWDSSMTEKGSSAPGILGIQAALGGDRVPFYLGPAGYVGALNSQTGMDTGVFGGPNGLVVKANTVEELEALPWATRCLSFGPELKAVCGGNKYRGHCWVDRSNFEWGGMNMSYVPQRQVDQPGGRASWHPGDRVHQINGRRLASLVLNAMRDALLLWKNSTDLVLKDEDWHVTDHYAGIKQKMATVFNATAATWCSKQSLPVRFCKVPVHGRTEFTPRYDPAGRSLRSLIKATRSPFIPRASTFDPPDVYHPDLHPPEGSLDVLAILESGVEFAPNLGRIRRRMSLPSAYNEVKVGGTSVDSKIVPGKGWDYAQLYTGTDMCDGEYDSWCKRDAGNACLLYSHNDGRSGLAFDGLSGWGIFELPNVREGLIAIKYHSWHASNSAAATSGWTTENNEPAVEGRRELKQKPAPYCPDFKFEFAIDGQITSWNLTQFGQNNKVVQRVVEVATLLDDPEFTGGESKNVELAIRMRGCKRTKTFALTHIYWA